MIVFISENVEYGGNFHCTLFAMHRLKFSFGGEFLSLLDRYGTCDVRENGDLGNLDVGANEGQACERSAMAQRRGEQMGNQMSA